MYWISSLRLPVKEIHLFDADVFSQHNAFRSPGAPTVDELRNRSTKVAFFKRSILPCAATYIAHSSFIDAANVDQLQQMDFVFLFASTKGQQRGLSWTSLKSLVSRLSMSEWVWS